MTIEMIYPYKSDHELQSDPALPASAYEQQWSEDARSWPRVTQAFNNFFTAF
jgi:hypothetical protein